jgi:hypothetical protein
MTISYNDTTFDVVDNGDGTFTLTPTAAFTADALIAEYREIREEAKRLLAYRAKLQEQLADRNARLIELRDRRDALKLLLETAGNDPDEDLTTDPGPPPTE